MAQKLGPGVAQYRLNLSNLSIARQRKEQINQSIDRSIDRSLVRLRAGSHVCMCMLFASRDDCWPLEALVKVTETRAATYQPPSAAPIWPCADSPTLTPTVDQQGGSVRTSFEPFHVPNYERGGGGTPRPASFDERRGIVGL